VPNHPSAFDDLRVPPTVSVWLGEPGRPPTYTHAADRTHYAASTMKLPLLVAAHRRHDRGELDLDTEVAVHNEHRSAYDGSPFALDQDDDQDDETWAQVGSTVTRRELARRAIGRSGNLATDLLLEHVGTAEVAAVLRDAGCSPATVLQRGIGDFAARDAGLDNLVTAADLARVIGSVTPAVEAVLAGQEHRDQIPAGLPEGTYVANKTGWVDGVAHDVALVRPEGHPAYVLVVLTTLAVPEEQANALIASVSAAVWEGHVR
jgi:beta-lactamase class A